MCYFAGAHHFQKILLFRLAQIFQIVINALGLKAFGYESIAEAEFRAGISLVLSKELQLKVVFYQSRLPVNAPGTLHAANRCDAPSQRRARLFGPSDNFYLNVHTHP